MLTWAGLNAEKESVTCHLVLWNSLISSIIKQVFFPIYCVRSIFIVMMM